MDDLKFVIGKVKSKCFVNAGMAFTFYFSHYKLQIAGDRA